MSKEQNNDCAEIDVLHRQHRSLRMRRFSLVRDEMERNDRACEKCLREFDRMLLEFNHAPMKRRILQK